MEYTFQKFIWTVYMPGLLADYFWRVLQRMFFKEDFFLGLTFFSTRCSTVPTAKSFGFQVGTGQTDYM